jgi:hypothetical protein
VGYELYKYSTGTVRTVISYPNKINCSATTTGTVRLGLVYVQYVEPLQFKKKKDETAEFCSFVNQVQYCT